jgi:serine/threonine protein kinase
MDPEVRLCDGRYVVRGLLGEGAQGVTYDAVTADGRRVAIKRFDVRGARSWKDVELAERETRVLATLDHPLVPRYIEHFEENGALYLVMEKVEGETLEAMRQRQGPLPEDEVRRFLADADRALTYLHGRSSPVVHRDVKPRNVVRRPNGSYVLVDFGAVSELIMRHGKASTIVGTMGYMAPEQFQGRALPSTDIYAVGATALAALTGVEPETLPHQGLRVDVRAALQGRVSPAMTASLEQMLEPDPDRRPTSLAVVLDGIRANANAHSHLHGHLNPNSQLPIPIAADLAKENAQVKSIRNLLWVLWGLSWILVPLLLSQFHAQRLIPIVMFGSLAGLFVVTWHKGAIIRAVLRYLFGADKDAGKSEGAKRHRVEVADDRQVRVHTSDTSNLHPEELVGTTEVESKESSAEARQMRR